METTSVANRRIWAEGETDGFAEGNPPIPGTNAPDVDMGPETTELEAEVTPHENIEDSTNKMEEIAQMNQDVNNKMSQEENQTPRAPQEQEGHPVSDPAPKVIDESPTVVEDPFPTTPPCSGLPSPAEGGAVIETEDQEAPEAESSDCVSDVEVISDPTDDVTSSDSQECPKWPLTSHPDDPVIEVEEPPVEVKEDGAENSETTGEMAAKGESTPEGQEDDAKPVEVLSEPVEKTSTHSTHQSLRRDSSDDVFFSIESLEPTVASEGDIERQNVDYKPLGSTAANRQDSIGSQPSQPTTSRSSSSCSQTADAVAQPSVPSEQQQGGQTPQAQPALEPDNQEAPQQVFNQGTPPLATVAMEPPNEGEAGSLGSGCVVMREREEGEEERREGAGTGGESGQKVSGLDTDEAEGEKQKGQIAGDSERVETDGQKEEKKKLNPGLNSEDHKGSRMETDSYDDSQSDSGVSADFSPCSTVELVHADPETPSPPANETPIEREIRRAMQREHSLRRSRGLQHATTTEYVDIPLRKAILTQPLSSKFDKGQGKDRQFAGKKMQKEIRLETQREQDLVQLGTVPGFYDKGTVRQLKERKQLFEAFQEPKDSSFTLSPQSKAPSWTSASDVSTLEVSGDESSNASTIGGSSLERRQSLELMTPTQGPSPVEARDGGFTYTPSLGPGLTEGTGSPVIILEDHLELPDPAQSPGHSHSTRESLAETQSLIVIDSASPCASSPGLSGEEVWGATSNGEIRNEEEEEEEEEVPRENPFFKLRASTALDKVGQDIREAKERERELRRQRSSLYGGAGAGARTGSGVAGGGSPGGWGRPASREVKSPRPPPSANGLATPDKPVAPLKTGTPAVRQSLGKLGMWPPVQTNEEEQISQPESPRVPRQKTPLLQRWESGLVNGHGEEEED